MLLPSGPSALWIALILLVPGMGAISYFSLKSHWAAQAEIRRLESSLAESRRNRELAEQTQRENQRLSRELGSLQEALKHADGHSDPLPGDFLAVFERLHGASRQP